MIELIIGIVTGYVIAAILDLRFTIACIKGKKAFFWRGKKYIVVEQVEEPKV